MCEQECLLLQDCDAWESWDFVGTTSEDGNERIVSTSDVFCHLYRQPSIEEEKGGNAAKSLAAYQAKHNHPGFSVGFLQRHAQLLTMKSMSSSSTPTNRMLYILHYHHKPNSSWHLSYLVNEMLPGYLPLDMFDIAVITPEPVLLPVSPGNSAVKSLVNPFVPRDPTSHYGANSYLSVNIARTKFPGYKGYLLVNDDAHIRFWDIIGEEEKRKQYFGNRPWVTFPIYSKPGVPFYDQVQRSLELPRQIKEHYPYGNYKEWAWWNRDSGSTSLPPLGEERSNFEAALEAVNELCATQGLKVHIPSDRKSLFCDDRNPFTLAPYVHGKADVFFVPDGILGDAFIEALQLFGSHDVMLEIAVPMVYALLVPDHLQLSIPYCDFVEREGEPYYQRVGEPFEEMQCTVSHPLKISIAERRSGWQKIVNDECVSMCRGYTNATIYSDPSLAAHFQETWEVK